MSKIVKIILVTGMVLWVVFLETIFYYNRFVYTGENTAKSYLSGSTRILSAYMKTGGGESFFGEYDLYSNKNGDSLVVYHKGKEKPWAVD